LNNLEFNLTVMIHSNLLNLQLPTQH